MVFGTIVIIEDVTRRVQLEEQLQISEKMASIGLLAAVVPGGIAAAAPGNVAAALSDVAAVPSDVTDVCQNEAATEALTPRSKEAGNVPLNCAVPLTALCGMAAAARRSASAKPPAGSTSVAPPASPERLF